MTAAGSSNGATGEARGRVGRGVLLTAIGGFAVLTAACAVAGVWAFAAPASPVASLAPLSPPHAALANQKLTPGAHAVDLDGAERETRRQLALSPTQATAWVRLAYIDYWRHGRLTPAALADLERSYDVAPLGPDATAARVTLFLELWESTPEPMRAQALREVAAMRERDRDATFEFARRIRNPRGRLAIGMAIAALESKDALKAWD